MSPSPRRSDRRISGRCKRPFLRFTFRARRAGRTSRVRPSLGARNVNHLGEIMIRCLPAFVFTLLLAQVAPAAELVRTARSGAWSAASTWVDGKVPSAGDRVQIRTGHRVLYDVSASPRIRSIHVAGTLTFATDRDTCLDLGVLKIQPGDDA